MSRATLICGAALMAIGTVFACSPKPPAAESPSAAADTDAKSRRSQSLLDAQALANRILPMH